MAPNEAQHLFWMGNKLGICLRLSCVRDDHTHKQVWRQWFYCVSNLLFPRIYRNRIDSSTEIKLQSSGLPTPLPHFFPWTTVVESSEELRFAHCSPFCDIIRSSSSPPFQCLQLFHVSSLSRGNVVGTSRYKEPNFKRGVEIEWHCKVRSGRDGFGHSPHIAGEWPRG